VVTTRLDWPWDVISAAMDGGNRKVEADSSSRHTSYLIGNSLSSGRIQATAEKLPCRTVRQGGNLFDVLECPSAGLSGDEGLQETVLFDDENIENWRYAPSPSSREHANDLTKQNKLFDELLNVALFLRRDVLEVRKSRKAAEWTGIIEALTGYVDDDPAPHALIVELSESIGKALRHVTAAPKRVLRRIRGQERVQRVRELDTACFIDLCRRPGMTVAEKAGPRQRLKAIQRTETIDILENRVALHTMTLASLNASRYLDEHETLQGSARVKQVNHFHRMIRQLSLSPIWHSVTLPNEPVRIPNYALLENPVYNRIWDAYQQLIRAEELRASLWRWRRRLWSDVFGMQLANAVQGGLGGNEITFCLPVSERRIVHGEYQFKNGRFIEPDCLPGPFIVKGRNGSAKTLWVIDHEGLMRLNHGKEFGLLNADYYLHVEGDNDFSIYPIYALDAGYPLPHPHEALLQSVLESVSLLGPHVKGAILATQHESTDRIQLSYRHCKGTLFFTSSNPARWNESSGLLKQIILNFIGEQL